MRHASCHSHSVIFNPAKFRAEFPAFADPVAWPDDMLQTQFSAACCYISPKGGKRLFGECLTRALFLMTAHLLCLLAGRGADGENTGGAATALVSGATVDKVSVTLTPPPLKSQWAWWLSLSPYGAALLALLGGKAAGGLYVGGSPPERAGFRKAGGVFETRKATS